MPTPGPSGLCQSKGKHINTSDESSSEDADNTKCYRMFVTFTPDEVRLSKSVKFTKLAGSYKHESVGLGHKVLGSGYLNNAVAGPSGQLNFAAKKLLFGLKYPS